MGQQRTCFGLVLYNTNRTMKRHALMLHQPQPNCTMAIALFWKEFDKVLEVVYIFFHWYYFEIYTTYLLYQKTKYFSIFITFYMYIFGSVQTTYDFVYIHRFIKVGQPGFDLEWCHTTELRCGNLRYATLALWRRRMPPPRLCLSSIDLLKHRVRRPNALMWHGI